MAMMLKRIFGNGSLPDDIHGELRTLLLQMRQERKGIEDAANRVEVAVKQANGLDGPVAVASERVAALEGRLAALEALTGRIDPLERRADEIECREAQTAALLRDGEQLAATTSGDLAAMRGMMEEVAAVRPHLEVLIEAGRAAPDLRAQLERVRADLASMGQQVDAVGERQAALAQSGSEAISKISAVEDRYDRMHAGFLTVDARATRIETVMQQLESLAGGLPDVRRELATLKALGDYVAQRIAELSEQRDVVDRAASQTERLGELVRRVDKELQTQHGHTKFLSKIQENVDAIRAEHDELLRRLDEIRARQESIATEDADRRQELIGMRDGLYNDVRDTLARIEFEREGIEAVNAHVAELRQQVSDVEHRFQSLPDVRGAIAGAEEQIDGLHARVGALTGEVDTLGVLAGRFPVLRAEAQQLDRTVREMEIAD
ncbi:MAG TPA: hypothetical protein VGA37_12905 [Gemmatimonadales bacterium]